MMGWDEIMVFAWWAAWNIDCSSKARTRGWNAPVSWQSSVFWASNLDTASFPSYSMNFVVGNFSQELRSRFMRTDRPVVKAQSHARQVNQVSSLRPSLPLSFFASLFLMRRSFYQRGQKESLPPSRDSRRRTRCRKATRSSGRMYFRQTSPNSCAEISSFSADIWLMFSYWHIPCHQTDSCPFSSTSWRVTFAGLLVSVAGVGKSSQKATL